VKMAIGVDIEKISRFHYLISKINCYSLNRMFTNSELDYAISSSSPESHLAVCFCAKEATIKALAKFCLYEFTLDKMGLYHDKMGMPGITIEGLPAHYDVSVSLSHSGNLAIASVLIIDITYLR
jgi:phosphopantetheine--protein transferase-like protein